MRAILLSAMLLPFTFSAMAAESDVANRNLGVNMRQVEQVKRMEAVKRGEVHPDRAEKRTPQTTPPTSASEVRIEKIEVYASQIEELTGPPKTPMQQFSERLERDRPLTPAEIALIVLNKLLDLGGPPPAKEPSFEERTQARVARGGTMLANPRGTLQ